MAKDSVYTDFYNSLSVLDEDNLDWLELEKIPKQIDNVFFNGPFGTEVDPVSEIVKLCLDTDYLFFTAKFILGIHLFPANLVVIEALWSHKYPMFIASRGFGKTWTLAVYCLLRMILEPGCKIAGVGSGLRQSRQIFDYMKAIWDKSPILQDVAGKNSGPKREQDRFTFTIGDSIASFFPIGTGDKIRGMRANYVLIDEFASVPEEIVNVVVRGFAVVNQDVENKVMDAYRKQRMKKENLWTEEMEELEKSIAQKNQIIYSGTAYYSFNHFYKYFVRWRKIIASRGDSSVADDVLGEDQTLRKDFDWRDYCIIRVPYTEAPLGQLDPSIIADAKVNLTSAQFHCEYSAVFSTDSDGFYKRSILEGATTNRPIFVNGQKVQFRCMRSGDPQKKYVIGVDPAADQDNAAIVILEINPDYRKIVNCWTTNRKKYQKIKKFYAERDIIIEDDYYRYVASKIKDFMSLFQVEHIIMDKNGGGIAIAEALGSKQNIKAGQHPVYPVIDPDDPKSTDQEEGIHILELLAPNADINADANHGMLKDFQNKELLFPMFDVVEMARAITIDMENKNEIDTYEDLVDEIEFLKNEIVSIVQSSTPSGKEKFDIPETKGVNSQKGFLRKDRFSALLYANYYVRNRGKNDIPAMKYTPVGQVKEKAIRKGSDRDAQMYTGLGLIGMNGADWLKGGNYRLVKKSV